LVEDHLYLGAFEIYRKTLNGAVTLERETLHVMDGKRRVALIETKSVGLAASAVALPVSVARYQFDNHQRSSALELDDNASIISYEEYYPFGSTSYQAVSGTIEVSAKRYRYSGEERDDETGLYYQGARYYACWLGKWTSCDPKGAVDGANLYIYVRNNPVGLNDPTGSQSEPGDVDPAVQHEKDIREMVGHGISLDKLVYYWTMTRGDFMEKYGFFEYFKFRHSVHELPTDVLFRLVPQRDMTEYLQPGGRVSIEDSQTATKMQNFNPGTPIGMAVSVGTRAVAAVAGASRETTENAAAIRSRKCGLASPRFSVSGYCSHARRGSVWEANHV
jgi:RHS repeat-associated protein